jgi:hypothetical protein
MTEKKSLLVRYKQYYTRGASWFSYIFQFGIITANAKLFEEFFYSTFGWNVIQTIIIGIILYILVSILIGRIDFHKGIWQDENDWVWQSTPSARELTNSIRRIEEALCRK